MSVRYAFAARPIGLAASATLAVGFIATAPAQSAFAAPQPASASVHDGTLVVDGSNGADAITIGVSANPSILSVDLGSGQSASFDRATFTSISVYLVNGDDTFAVNPTGKFRTGRLTVSGGNGNDTIGGSQGADVLSGDNGNDTIRGNDGNDLILGGNGNDNVDGERGVDTEFLGLGDDTALWLPGEASDIVDGGQGHDDLVFDGSSGNEKFAVTANGTRVAVTRDLGSVHMDLVGVEQLDLFALAGTDTIAVGDLRGTDLDTANLDLSTAGTSDGQLDTVLVAGTDQADNVGVDAVGTSVDVTGLRTLTRISGADSRDQLQVATGNGNDTVAVSDAARSLITVAVDLGAGQI